MGIFDVHARSWQAPSRQEQAHKSELHTLEEAEERKRRQMKHELETLRKVEDLQQESAQDAKQMLRANARDAARRRAVSGLNDREALLLAQREHNTARLRNAAAYPHSHAQLSPNVAMLSSPALSSVGSVPIINVPSSPGLLGSGLHHNIAATPRMRTVSAHHPRTASELAGFPSLGIHQSPAPGSHNVYAGSPALGLPLPRPRAVSSVGLGNPATVERLRLEDRKRALLHREAALQADREQRLREKKSMLDLEGQEFALRKKAQELDARAKIESRERFLDNQEAQLNHRQEHLMEAEMAERLRQLTVNTPSLNPLHASPRLGHTRHLSSPGYASQSPRMNDMLSSGNPALLAEAHLGDGLLSNSPYSGMRHQRARSIGQSPLLGSHALDASMAADAARLGILPAGLGIDGLGSGSMAGLDDRAALYARAGVSPRFGPADSAYNAAYGPVSHGLVNGYSGIEDLDLDGLGGSGGYSRSRRGSLSQANEFGVGTNLLDPGYGASLGRDRRDSLPFQF